VLSQSVLETGVIESWQGCFMLLSLPKFPLSYLFSLENPLKGYEVVTQLMLEGADYSPERLMPIVK
jgi:hypothetical protein